MEEDFGTALKKSLKHDFTLIFIRNAGTNSLTLLKRLGNIRVVRGNDLLRYQRIISAAHFLRCIPQDNTAKPR